MGRKDTDGAVLLESEAVQLMLTAVEESTRASGQGVTRFVEPAQGTLRRAIAKRHHIVFGRRGSGKTSLLRKAAAELTIDRRPIAFIDLEPFKGHTYPDVLLSVLITTFAAFATWLGEAGRAPANKTSFWKKLFGTKPTRPPLDKVGCEKLIAELESQVQELQVLLHSHDGASIRVLEKASNSSSESDDIGVELKAGRIVEFCTEKAQSNCFLVQRDRHEEYIQLIAELVDMRMIHLVRSRTSVAHRKGKRTSHICSTSRSTRVTGRSAS